MLKILHFLLAITVIGIVLYLASMNRKNIKIRFIIQLIIIEIIVAYFLLASNGGKEIVQVISLGFDYIMQYATEGTKFVFGSVVPNDKFVFFFNVLMPIVLVSALIGILQYFKILPLIICGGGWLLSKINGMGRLESFNALSSLILGQSENFIAYKNILSQISEQRMYTMAATAMSTVSLAIVGSYMQILDAQYIIAALILNMLSTFIVLHVLNPYNQEQERSFEEMSLQSQHKQSFFEMLSEYILDGFKIAIIVGAMLIGFIALLAMLNGIFNAVFGISFQALLGYIFSPFAWILGIPASDMVQAGGIIATKLVSNEFVAMLYLKDHLTDFSSHSITVLSVFLVSFANFGSIGIIVGAVQALDTERAKFVSRHGWRLVFGATMVSFLSALIAGFVV
ncbi:NupC/NupG family nucleoside CNT transporter [Fastidiosibacter lacustris]|uniref:NupC/NupG family nucleoside CNT transporter n=1 Tax=Fastidiosibacter lacustris TaxID=2056695 RepID=UPI000E342989|nr:nucleoside transporter C-terminal domain-containing protein [Fastidiosibacter lacustris]